MPKLPLFSSQGLIFLAGVSVLVVTALVYCIFNLDHSILLYRIHILNILWGIVSVWFFFCLFWCVVCWVFLTTITEFLMLGSTSASLFVHFYVNSCHKWKKNYLFPSLNSFSITSKKNDSRFLNTFVSLFKKIFINSWQKCIHISDSFHRAVVRSLLYKVVK